MAQPPPYDRSYNFHDYQAENPLKPLPADKLDEEFSRVKTTLDAVLQNLALIQRDDTALANKSVGYDQLKDEIQLGFNPPTDWTANHSYVARDTVFVDVSIYRCLVSHISSNDFEDDLNAGYWELVVDFASVQTAAIEARDAALQAQADAEAAQQAAEDARDDAIAAKNLAEGFKDDAEAARDAAAGSASSALSSASAASASASTAATHASNASNSASAASSSASSANNAKVAAENARDASVVAQGLAEAAQAGAEQAQADAEAAQQAAEDARDDAQLAKSGAESARDAAIGAKNDAVYAKTASESARDASVVAQGLAEAAQAAAEQAQADAEAAQQAAEDARDDAVDAKNAAHAAAAAAAGSASSAAGSASTASTQASAAASAKTAAESARDAAIGAKNDAVAAKTASELARDASEAAKGLAEAAQAGAELAQSKAEAAQLAAENARDAAIGAKDGAEDARDDAEAAALAAVGAKSGAEDALSGSLLAKAGAESARDAAVVARGGAESARDAAVVARGVAESARDAAVVAKNAAEDAQADAEAAQSAAENARDAAIQAKNDAEGFKDDAESAASDAQDALSTAQSIYAKMSGGLTGQFLMKQSNDDYDYTWGDVAGGGIMLVSVYDPNGVAADAFNMDNMVEGLTNKILTAAERADIAANTSARHTHSNKSILDATEEAFTTALLNAITANTSARHTHSNKSILDATEQAFTTALKSKLDGIESNADVTDTGNVGAAIHGSSAKATPVDADTVALIDSAASNTLKKLSWANIKATLKSYFDTLYAAVGHSHSNATTSDAGFMSAADKQKLDGVAEGATANTGTVTSVQVSVPTGLQVSGGPITTSGTLTISYASGYQGYTTAEANKLAGIQAGAQVNAVTSVAGKTGAVTLSSSDISGLGNAATRNVGTTSGTVAAGDDSRITGALQRSGGTMTGALTLSGNPTNNLHAATKQYVDALPRIGEGQTWQDVTAARIAGTAYQNTTNKTIAVIISVNQDNSVIRKIEVSNDGSIWLEVGRTAAGGTNAARTAHTLIVPPGGYYRAGTGIDIISWTELR